MKGAYKGYLLSPAARADLDGIWLYSARQWSIEQADKYYNDLLDRIELLAVEPKVGISIGQVRKGYRRLNFRSHAIYYRSLGEVIEIIRILHSSMDFARHL
jgi:toxin ParE1/3/4